MNITEYISSGIVENYVLGLTDEVETAEFERMCATHPEVKDAREAFEILLEQQALYNAIQPPAELKSKIFSEIDVDNDKRSAPVISMGGNGKEDPAIVRRLKSLRFVNIAAIFLLVVSTILNFYFFSLYKTSDALARELSIREQALTKKSTDLQDNLTAYKFAFYVLKDTNMVEVKMPAVEGSPSPTSFATVYWGKKTNEVFLLVKKMPDPAADKQYQLWAIKGGKPFDIGTFDLESDSTLIKLKNIDSAEAFAVTLEKKGGSPTPSMKQMYVFGSMKKVEG